MKLLNAVGSAAVLEASSMQAAAVSHRAKLYIIYTVLCPWMQLGIGAVNYINLFHSKHSGSVFIAYCIM